MPSASIFLRTSRDHLAAARRVDETLDVHHPGRAAAVSVTRFRFDAVIH